jgi:hypothetical protein
MEAGKRNGQPKSARPRASWIDVKDVVSHAFSRLMGVPANDNLKAGRRGIQIQGIHVVKNVEKGGASFGDGSFRQGPGPRGSIHVSAHGDDRRESAQGIKNFRPTNITCVEDEFRTAKRLQGLRAEQSVCI